MTVDHPVGQVAPVAMADNQFGNGGIDGRVFQLVADTEACLQIKREVVAEHRDEHVGRQELNEPPERTVTGFIAERLRWEWPNRFSEDDLVGQSFEDLAMRVPEDLAITCVQVDDRGAAASDLLAAVHVCAPSGWRPREKLGQSFAQVHRTVQIPPTRRFLMEDGKVKDYVGQMMRCIQPHVRFIWTIQRGDARNRNPQCPPSNSANRELHFRVERQTITGFPEVAASLFTIRTYLYPLEQVASDPVRRELLRDAILAMPPRVLAYKGLDDDLVRRVAAL